ncbi:MAG: MFS transporter [Phototrophicales bacterium]|nr:MAG: MFS transporter [Phototrophicales bacterium]
MAKRTFFSLRPDGISRNVWASALTSFLNDVSSELIFTLMPLFLANVLGVSTVVIGFIDGLVETTSSFMKGFSGWLSDRLANRKWLVVAGYGMSSLIKPVLYFVTSWYGVLVVRFIDRTGKGIRTSPRDALIADSTDENHRGIAFGLHRAADTSGAMLGLLIALWIVLLTQSEALTLSRQTFQWLVIIGTVPSFLALFVLIVGIQEIRPQNSVNANGERISPALPPSLKFSALSKEFRLFLLIVAIFTIGNSSDGFIILRAQERGLSVAQVLGMLITFNFIYAFLAGPIGAWSDRIGRKRIILGGWLIYGLVYLGLAFAETGAQIWVMYSLYGIYYAATQGTAKAVIADFVPMEQRGVAYGYYNAIVGFMALPSSLLAGVLWQGIGDWDGFGPSAPFMVGALLALLATTLFGLFLDA